MDIVLISLITSGIAVLILVVINVFLFVYSYKTNKMVNQLLEKGKIKDFKDIFLSQKNNSARLEGEISDAFVKIKNLENTCEKTLQKIGIVRFNPFNDVGGNQSFAVALLDNKNDGFIISCIFAKEGSRVYAKTIKKGKSEYILSKDELEAIDQAIKYKK